MALISVAQALEQVLAHASPLPPDEVPLDKTNGSVLAYDLKALRTQPPADVSAMDGYAVRAADVAKAPVRLKVIGEVPAGQAIRGQHRSGTGGTHFHRRLCAQRRGYRGHPRSDRPRRRQRRSAEAVGAKDATSGRKAWTSARAKSCSPKAIA